jgi:hypothetical protein
MPTSGHVPRTEIMTHVTEEDGMPRQIISTPNAPSSAL